MIYALILFISFLMGDIEPFDNYKSDKSYEIINAGSKPVLDGNLNDDCWDDIVAITSFVQLEPNHNTTPTELSSVKIIQDKYAIYIGAQLFDKNPGAIIEKFVNRDDFRKLSMSDWFSISIDSYHDHQTGHEFIVNAAGVQFDSFLYDDTVDEMNWDGAWESMVSIDEQGWVVEMRIPFSLLRFTDNKDLKWGLNLKRYIHRKNESIEWIALPKGTEAQVSKFGHLTNIQDIKNETIFEITPYLSMGQLDLIDYDYEYDDWNIKEWSEKTLYYPTQNLLTLQYYLY